MKIKYALVFALIIFNAVVSGFASAECGDRALTITNNSNRNIQIFLNDKPYLILLPGDSRTTDILIQSGQNKVVAKPLTKTGAVDPNAIGPTPTKFDLDCSTSGQTSVTFEKKHFKKKKFTDGHGHALPPKKAKKVGNKGGATLDINGRWFNLDSNAMLNGCYLDIVDTGDLFVALDYTCFNRTTALLGFRLAGRFFFSGESLTGLTTINGDFGIFENVLEGEDTEGKTVDVLKGKFIYVSNVGSADQKQQFARLNEGEE